MENPMADKDEREKDKQNRKGQAPNLGQNEAQQQQRSDDDLSQMGDRTRQRDQGRSK